MDGNTKNLEDDAGDCAFVVGYFVWCFVENFDFDVENFDFENFENFEDFEN